MEKRFGNTKSHDPQKEAGSPLIRGVVLGVLVLFYAVGGFCISPRPEIRTVFAQLAYIPIVLAGLWWGKKSVYVALLLAVSLFSVYLQDEYEGTWWSDGTLALFFVAAAFTLGWISERLDAGQKALDVSRARYRLLIQKSLAGIFVYRDEKILFCNDRLASLLGYEKDRLIGEPVWRLIHEQEQPRLHEYIRRRKEEGVADMHYEARLVTRKGRVVWADIASSLLDYEGSPAVLVNVYDITARKEAERKRRELMRLAHEQEEQLVHSSRLAELGEMTAAIAHEVNQPLTGIRNFARNAAYMIEENAGSPAEIQENLRLISEQVDRASKIINQMRQLTRKTESRPNPVDLNDVIRETLDFLMPQIRLSNVEVSVNLAEDLPPVMGDKIRIEQVFLNIVTNAIQAMEEVNLRRLTVTTVMEDSGDHPVRVDVLDTGRGFGSEEAEKLFTPFYSTKKPGQGTGLGLSISLRIVKDHHGLLSATGEPGGGARFTIRLPLAGDAGRGT
jgi:PAS domain S-box-containing protein